jgi:protein gp37
VFCASLADVFEDWKGNILTHDGQVAKYADGWGPVGIGRDTDLQTHEARRLATMDDARAKLFKLIDETPHLDWLLLTKRPENIRRMMFDPDTLDGWVHRSNLWLGTSIATQPDAFKNVPELLECENIASVLFLSMEPLLEFVSLSDEWLSRLDWVIVGGESGHDSRPMRIELPRSLRDQCVKAGVAFHFKQWGEWAPFSQLPDETFQAVDLDKVACNVIGEHSMHRVGKKLAGRMLDGRTWDEFPAVKVPVSV